VGSTTIVDESRIANLEAEVAALNELLSVQERVVAEQSEKLKHYAMEVERANEEVKHFAYIVSHDLRAPLINLKGFAAELRESCSALESCQQTVLQHLTEEQQTYSTTIIKEDIPEALKFIESSVSRMDHLINAVLKLSRLGRRELVFKPVDLNEITTSVLNGLNHQLEESHTRVTVSDLPEVIADQTAMEQVLGNILANAVNYLEPERPGEIEIAGERDKDQITFHIKDNGRGISEDDMPKVFAPFRRAGKQNVQGEGMGLAYVQMIVRRHGGDIKCESQLGVGTKFIVTLPNKQ